MTAISTQRSVAQNWRAATAENRMSEAAEKTIVAAAKKGGVSRAEVAQAERISRDSQIRTEQAIEAAKYARVVWSQSIDEFQRVVVVDRQKSASELHALAKKSLSLGQRHYQLLSEATRAVENNHHAITLEQDLKSARAKQFFLINIWADIFG